MSPTAQPVEAIIFIGVQGSGKSTFYRQRFLETHVRISLDMLRTRQREQLFFTTCLEAKQPFRSSALGLRRQAHRLECRPLKRLRLSMNVNK